jgi:biotin-dependent carboxylase-like uncharacterized protein
VSAALKVQAPGLFTTVQDLGRVGYQAQGVPVAGALDSFSLKAANALVGNPLRAAALEILMQGPTLEVAADSVRVALAGTTAKLEILGDAPAAVPPWQSVTLRRGQAFRVGVLAGAGSAYLAVEGGFALEPRLGSLSTHVRAAVGGLQGRPLKAGDLLPLKLAEAPERGEVRLVSVPDLGLKAPIRVVLGPQDDYFTEEAIATFTAQPYTVSREADRMGLRLEGPPLAHRDGYNIVSDGVATGAIQVPGSRQPILLLADHQTTGGYPKIATVIAADLPLAGRRKPGDEIRFAAVGVAEAEGLARAAERDFQQLVADLAPADDATQALDLESLYSNNLVSGVISGSE